MSRRARGGLPSRCMQYAYKLSAPSAAAEGAASYSTDRDRENQLGGMRGAHQLESRVSDFGIEWSQRRACYSRKTRKGFRHEQRPEAALDGRRRRRAEPPAQQVAAVLADAPAQNLQRKVRQQLEAQQSNSSRRNEEAQRAASAAASAAAMAQPHHATTAAAARSAAGISLPPMMPAGIPQPHITYLPQHVPPPQPINFQQMHQQQVQQQFLQSQPQPQQQQQQLMLQPVAAAGGTMPVRAMSPVNAPLPAGFGSLSAKHPLRPVYPHRTRVPTAGATFGLAGQHVSNQAQVMPHAVVPVPPAAARRARSSPPASRLAPRLPPRRRPRRRRVPMRSPKAAEGAAAAGRGRPPLGEGRAAGPQCGGGQGVGSAAAAIARRSSLRARRRRRRRPRRRRRRRAGKAAATPTCPRSPCRRNSTAMRVGGSRPLHSSSLSPSTTPTPTSTRSRWSSPRAARYPRRAPHRDARLADRVL